jgi:hypothetical protein
MYHIEFGYIHGMNDLRASYPNLGPARPRGNSSPGVISHPPVKLGIMIERRQLISLPQGFRREEENMSG